MKKIFLTLLLLTGALAFGQTAAAAIVAEPVSLTKEEGENAVFTVKATGIALKYQWEVLTPGGQWKDIDTAKAATYTALKVTKALDGNEYRCRVYDDGIPTYSLEATLNVNSKTSVVTPLTSVLLFADGQNELSVEAKADESIRYTWEVYTPATKQWELCKDSTLEEPQGTLTLDIDSNTFVKGMKYRCKVWSGRNTKGDPKIVVSKDIVVTTCARTTVDFAKTHNPYAFSQAEYPGLALANYKAVFAVTAKGTAIKYQWESTTDGITWTAIDKAVAATYTTPVLTPEDFGKTYRCAVTNTAGTERSDDITITKMQVATLEGDRLPADVTCANTDIAEFTVTPSALSGNPAKLTYKWEVSFDGGTTWKTAGAAQTLKVSKPAVALSGNQYRCTVSNAATPKNNPPPAAVSRAATLTVRAQAIVGTQPKAVTTYENLSATYTVGARGYELQYQWEIYNPLTKQWTDIAGATNATVTINIDTSYPKGTQVRCKTWSTGIGNTVNSAAVALNVNAAAYVAADPVSLTKEEGENAVFTVKGGGYAPKYQWEVLEPGGQWRNVDKAVAATYTVVKVTKALDNNQYRCRVYNNGANMPSAAATLNVNYKTEAVAPLTAVLLFEGGQNQLRVEAKAEKSIEYLWEVYNPVTKQWTACEDGSLDQPTGTLTLDIDAATFVKGMKYHCKVWSGRDTEGDPKVVVSKDIVVTLCARTTVAFAATHNPNAFSQTEFPGLALANYKAVFAVTAKGTAIKYQWESTTDGITWTAIDKATAATYTTPALTPEDFGKTYRCAVTNTAGTERSDDITITKMQVAALEASGLPEDITCANTDIAEFRVTPTALSGNPAKLTYKWEVSTDGGTTWKAAGAAQVLKVSKPAVTLSGNQYRCTVSNAATPKNNPPPAAVSRAATLTVRAQAAFTVQPKAAVVYGDGTATYTVTAKGYDLKYQWEIYDPLTKLWSPISGATSQTLGLDVTMTSHPAGTKVRCNVWSEGIGNVVTSAAVTLTMREPVGMGALTYQQTYAGSNVIDVTQGGEVDCYIDYPALLKVVVSGYGPKCQWYRSINGATFAPVSKATSTSYKLAGADLVPGNVVQFYCKVYNDGGELYSKTVSVNMFNAPAPKSLEGTGCTLTMTLGTGATRTLYVLATGAKECTVIDYDSPYAFMKNATYTYSRTDPHTANLTVSMSTEDDSPVTVKGTVVFDTDLTLSATIGGDFAGTFTSKAGTTSAQGFFYQDTADSAPANIIGGTLSMYLLNGETMWTDILALKAATATVGYGHARVGGLYYYNDGTYTYKKMGRNIALVTMKFSLFYDTYNITEIVVWFNEDGTTGIFRCKGTVGGVARKGVGDMEYVPPQKYSLMASASALSTGSSGNSYSSRSDTLAEIREALKDSAQEGDQYVYIDPSANVTNDGSMSLIPIEGYDNWYVLRVAPQRSPNALDGVQIGDIECLSDGAQVPNVLDTFEVSANGDIVLQVNATGADLRYQWYLSGDGENWTELTGATDSSCHVFPLGGDEAVSYRCEVSNGTNTATSEDVTLIIRTGDPRD